MLSRIVFALGTSQEIADFFTTLSLSREFHSIASQTETYKQWVTEQWEDNYFVSSQAICEMTGLDVERDLTVLITYPSLSTTVPLTRQKAK